MVQQADVVVVGLGPGGEDLAGRLARAGLEVIGVDGGLVGGECPYWGCVPSKMMIRAANLLAEARRIPGMAGAVVVTPDWAPVARRIREEATDNWDDTVALQRLERNGVEFVRGWAKVTGRDTVEVNGEILHATRALVLDTGAAPWAPPIPGLADIAYWTNRHAVEAEVLPSSLIVLGGGAIGVELAQVFARFGVSVTVVEAAPALVPIEEPEAGDVLGDVFAREGIAVHVGAEIAGARAESGAFVLDLGSAGDVRGEQMLVATGRRPDLDRLGVASIGVDPRGRSIAVDEHMRVTDGVWAIGDAVGHGAFTHMSMYQAEIAASDILGHEHTPARYDALARVTFTDPEIGSVGLSEAEARQAGVAVRTGFARLATSSRGWIHKAGNDGFIKLVVDADRNVLVGATSAGPAGGEVLAMLTLAVHAGIDLGVMDQMIYAYPTFHRAVQEAVRSVG
ncbi:MAG: dihydrolipoyl dehydrogenase family protein [Acidimicrobiales bacterium]